MEKLLLKLYSEDESLADKEFDFYISQLEERYKNALPKYDLWQKYLKRSNKYKTVCEWIEDDYHKSRPDFKHFERSAYDLNMFADACLSFFYQILSILSG